MKSNTKKTIRAPWGYRSFVMVAFPQLLLIVVAAALLVMMVIVCARFTKGPESTSALRKQLQLLQAKFTDGRQINPEKEREIMERLQNKIKTASGSANITSNAVLKQLSNSVCNSISAVLTKPSLENKTSWLKLNALMKDFDRQYYSVASL